jgi:hypothetical protein
MDETKLDGYKRFLYLVLGVAGSTVMSLVNDPAKQAVANQAITLAVNLVPVGAGAIGTIVQGFIDIFKVKAAAEVAVAEKPKVTMVTQTTSTPMFDNPEYGQKPVSQMDSFNKGLPEPQIKPDFPNTVSKNLEVWSKMAGTDEGAFQILMDRIGVFIDEEYKRWSTAALQDVASLQEFASRYLGVKLTPQDCEAISANKNLASVIHAEADKTIIASIYTAHKAGTLGKGVWEGCMERALYYARKSVLDTVSKKLISEDISLAREGMSDLGLNGYTQRTAISSGGTWYVNIGGGPRVCDPFSLAGIDSITMKPLV